MTLQARGCPAPALAIGDGALGFWAALDEICPQTRQQRCWCPKTQNGLHAFPKRAQPKAKQAFQGIWQAETKGLAEQAFARVLDTYELQYPKATACWQKDREELLLVDAFPVAHGPSLRTTNPSE